ERNVKPEARVGIAWKDLAGGALPERRIHQLALLFLCQPPVVVVVRQESFLLLRSASGGAPIQTRSALRPPDPPRGERCVPLPSAAGSLVSPGRRRPGSRSRRGMPRARRRGGCFPRPTALPRSGRSP